jgi:cytochrome c2
MKINAAIVFVAFAVMLAAFPTAAQAQQEGSDAPQFVVDKALAKTGKNVWSAKGCMGCHTIGKGKLAGPDLNGLYERRQADWVKTWLKNPEAMYETDETVKAMLKEWNGLKMPNLKLKDNEIDAVMHYIGEQQKTKKK